MINYWAIGGMLGKIAESGDTDYSAADTWIAQSQEVLPWLAISWTQDQLEFRFVCIAYLKEFNGYLVDGHVDGALCISPGGWNYLDSLGREDLASTGAFVAMWFDPSLSPVWTDALYPAMSDAGYDPIRIDLHPHNNRIDDEIIVMIRACRFLVADLTGQRGGVYFEAGFALGLGKPVIWLCRDDEVAKVHFDNRQYNFIRWNPEKLSELRRNLRNRIESTIGSGPHRAK